jgi:hypothetical protein
MGPWARNTNSEGRKIHDQRMILAAGDGVSVRPDRGNQSSHRHGWHERHLKDLPA